MKKKFHFFCNFPLRKEIFKRSDVIIFFLFFLGIFIAIAIGKNAPEVVKGPVIKLSPKYLPLYAGLSILRMLSAYILSILFTLFYGHMAARSKMGEKILIPLLDIFQSVPMLSFLPLALIAFTKIFPSRLAIEMSAIFLLFTCQGWNIAFSWYQSLITIPREFREVSKMFKFNWWIRFKKVELPFASVGIIWNSMLSWAGGWFFLMAAEMFVLKNKDFRLPGLGSYLQQAATSGNIKAIGAGIATLVLVIILMDQFVWKPLLCWTERFKPGLKEEESSSWFYDLIRGSVFLNYFYQKVLFPLSEKIDLFMIKKFPCEVEKHRGVKYVKFTDFIRNFIFLCLVSGGIYSLFFLRSVSFPQWIEVLKSAGMTFLRVFSAVIIALLWTVPAGVVIGFNKKLSKFLQPIIQIFASFPATALFPVILFWLLSHNLTNLNIYAIFLMVLGSQWYLLFNVIAGASSIPEDLKTTSYVLPMTRFERWKTLIFPAIFPYLVTGLITVSGGCWNVSIIAEYINFSGKVYCVKGLGSLISQSTSKGNYHLLFASTLSMIMIVVLINRLFWRRLYQLAEDKFSME